MLVGCKEKKQSFTEYTFDYFDTVTTITGYEKSKEDFDENLKLIKSLFSEYNNLYTIYKNNTKSNNLYAINSLEGSRKDIKTDKKIIDLLKFSREMYSLTNGNTNIAFGSVLSIWHTYRTTGMNNPDLAELPPKNQLENASKHTDIENLVINEVESTVSLLDDKLLLDVGAIAKGYAVEMVAAELEKRNVSGYILNVGGNVKCIGSKPDGSKFTVGIENLTDDSEDNPYLAQLSIADMSVVTSGSYQRFYTINGINYHHIIDPETLMPASNFKSVSVICKNSGVGDALSTALFIMDFDEGERLINSLKDTEAIWLFNDDTVKKSSGFDKYLK